MVKVNGGHFAHNGTGGRIRTCDLYIPNVAT